MGVGAPRGQGEQPVGIVELGQPQGMRLFVNVADGIALVVRPIMCIPRHGIDAEGLHVGTHRAVALGAVPLVVLGFTHHLPQHQRVDGHVLVDGEDGIVVVSNYEDGQLQIATCPAGDAGEADRAVDGVKFFIDMAGHIARRVLALHNQIRVKITACQMALGHENPRTEGDLCAAHGRCQQRQRKRGYIFHSSLLLQGQRAVKGPEGVHIAEIGVGKVAFSHHGGLFYLVAFGVGVG